MNTAFLKGTQSIAVLWPFSFYFYFKQFVSLKTQVFIKSPFQVKLLFLALTSSLGSFSKLLGNYLIFSQVIWMVQSLLIGQSSYHIEKERHQDLFLCYPVAQSIVRSPGTSWIVLPGALATAEITGPQPRISEAEARRIEPGDLQFRKFPQLSVCTKT